MSSTAKLANFDPAVGSTVNKGIDAGEGNVPDVTNFMKETAYISIMTPFLDQDPNDPNCIWGAPAMYWGLPAVAKSSRVAQAAHEANMLCNVIFPGQQQPEDFSGVLAQGPTGLTIECMLGAVRRLNPIGRGVIFLDEINNATRATESALLGFVQNRRVGDTPIAPGIRILGAANPPKWSVNGFQMAPPTANRWCHFQVKCPPHRSWINRVVTGPTGILFDAKGTEDNIRARWRDVYSHVLALVTGYIEHSPVSLHCEPEPENVQSGYNWGSPRTWELAARMKATSEILGYSDEITNLCVEGCIGEGLAFDFLTWMRNADLPKPSDVLLYGWKPDMRRLDVAYAVLTSTTQYVISTANRAEAINHAVGMWKLLSVFVEHNMGDMAVSSAVALVEKNLSRKAGPDLLKVADPVIRWMIDNKLLAYAQNA